MKTNVPGFEIDQQTRAVINTNVSEYQRLINERTTNKRLITLEGQMATVIAELALIKARIDVRCYQ